MFVIQFCSPVLCADVEELSDSLVSQLNTVCDSGAVGDSGFPKITDVTLSADEYAKLTLRLVSADDAARQTAEQLERALTDLEKMRSFILSV